MYSYAHTCTTSKKQLLLLNSVQLLNHTVSKTNIEGRSRVYDAPLGQSEYQNGIWNELTTTVAG